MNEERGAGRRLVSSGGPWEELAGYSRAVAIGESCWVAGTSDAGPDGRSLNPGDAIGQAREIFRRIEAALGEAGFAREEIVRVRIFVTQLDETPALLALMGELFGRIRPAATLVQVAGLIDPSLIVEIEAEAHHAPEA